MAIHYSHKPYSRCSINQLNATTTRGPRGPTFHGLLCQACLANNRRHYDQHLGRTSNADFFTAEVVAEKNWDVSLEVQ